MSTKIRKWGNSLGLRIPKAIAEQVGVYEGAEVDFEVEGERLIIHPKASPRYDLEALLAAVTDENLQGEVDTGPALGREAW